MTFTLLSFNLLHFISSPSNHSLTCAWFYLRYKLRKLYKAECCPFPGVLKVANFFLPYLCSVFLLLGRKPDVWRFSTNYARSLFLQLCQGPYFYLRKVLLPISSQVVHKYVYCVTLGNVVRVYPRIIQGLTFLSV